MLPAIMPESNKSSITLVVLALVAGLVAALLWMRSSSNTDGEPSEDEAAASDQVGPKAGASARRGPRTPSAGALLGADKAVISGTVRDSSGAGIGGAQVCALADDSELLGAGDDLPRCTTAEGDGHYRLEGLWPVRTSVSASAPRYKPERWTEEVDGDEDMWLRLRAGQERAGVDITLESGGVAVRGVVKDISGGVIADALVSSGPRWWFSGAGLSAARTDDEGRFELWAAPGQISLRAWAEGYAETAMESSAPTELAELYLTPESVISGTVIHAETKQPLAGVTVTASGSSLFDRGGSEALSDEQGRFRIDGVQPGSYDLSLRADEFYGEAAEKVHLGLAETVDDLVVEAHPAFYVEGTVAVAGTETPCTRGYVSLENDAGHEVGAGLDDEGHVTLRGLLPGEYEVELRCSDYVAEPEYEAVVLVDHSLDGLVWEVREGLAIRGVVVDGAGQPAARVSVSARAKVDKDNPRAQQTSAWGAETQDDGGFELRGLLAGSYELGVYSNEYPRLDDKTRVELSDADIDGLRLELPASGELRGIVRDDQGEPVHGVTVEVRSVEGRWDRQQTVSGDDGRFELSGIALGSNRVTARQGWFETMRAPGTTDDDVQGQLVDIVEGAAAEVELVVESHRARISGRVVDSTGAPLGDAFVDATRMSDSAGASARRGIESLRWGWDRQPVLSDQDGSFELDELAEGDYIVRAYRKGGGEAIVEGVAAGSAGVELAIVDTGEILGQVTLAGGGSPERFELSVVDRKQGVSRQDSAFRTDGAFAMRELPPGSYELSVEAPEGSAKTELSLAAGEVVSDVRLELTPKITVRGRLVDADSGAPVSGMRVSVRGSGGGFVFTNNGKGGEEISDADGAFTVEDAVAGEVSLSIMPRNFGEDDVAYGWSSRPVTLAAEPATQDLGDIELIAKRLGPKQRAGDLGYTLADADPETEPEERRHEVALVRPGGPADGSGLEPGDVIVEVDGKSVSGLDSHRYGPLVRAPQGTELSLTLDDGETVKIVIGPPRE